MIVLMGGGQALAWDKKLILKKLAASQSIKESYSAKIRSKMMMANQVVSDSGRLEVLAPNCQKMIWSSVTQSTCGDTTWIRSPNGDVTRSIGANASAMPGIGGHLVGLLPIPGQNAPSSGAVFDTLNAVTLLPPSDSGTVKLGIGDLKSETGIIILDIDTTHWLPIKATSRAPGNPEIEVGFRYSTWKGRRLMAEIRMVMPNGFVVFEVSGFEAAKGLRRKSFQLL